MSTSMMALTHTSPPTPTLSSGGASASIMMLAVLSCLTCVVPAVNGQGEAATPVQDYFPVGVVSQANGVTQSPNAYVGPLPPTPEPITYPPTPSPASAPSQTSGAILRSRIDVTCTFFHEDRIAEYQELLSAIAYSWLLAQSSNHSKILFDALQQMFADYSTSVGGAAVTPAQVYSGSAQQGAMVRRLVPLRSLSLVGRRGGACGGGAPSRDSVQQFPQPVALDYGTYSVASFVLLPLTNATLDTLGLAPVSTNGNDDDALNFQFPYSGTTSSGSAAAAAASHPLFTLSSTSTAPTSETDYLCEAFAAAFTESILSQPRARLTSVSSPSAWLLSGIVSVRCPRLLVRTPLSGTVGVNYLWVVFIVMGVLCVSGAIYALFWRSTTDQDVDINADEKEKVAAALRSGVAKQDLPPPSAPGLISSSDDEGHQQQREQEQRRRKNARAAAEEMDDGNDLVSRIDSKTESIYEIRSTRSELLDKRKTQRIRDLVAKALTGDSTIYGASDEEREMVAMILKNPRFDGGRLQLEGEASPVEVVLNNDRLFLLPPTDIRLATKVQGKFHKGQGRVTSVSFPVSVDNDGSIGSGGGRNMYLADVVTAGSLSSQMDAAQRDSLRRRRGDGGGDEDFDEDDDDNGNESSPLVGSSKAGSPSAGSAGAAPSPHSPAGSEADDVDEATRINRMITAAALRGVQRREGQLALESQSKIKERLQRILEADVDDDL